MPYILLDETGKIYKVSVRQLGGGELVPHSHPDVAAFLIKQGQDPHQVENALAELRRTDNEMARTVEDVVVILMKKNLLKMTDMPKPVQDRIAFRVKQRMLIQDVYDQASAKTGAS